MNIFRKSASIVLPILFAAAVSYAALSVFRFGAYTAVSNSMKNDTCKIIAHRGGAGLGPENTLECIRLGIEAGADAVEIDLHLSRDGVPVVCHDPTVDRTTDGKGRIADLTLEQLRALHILVDGQPVAAQIPTLAEVLEAVGDRADVLAEIKKDRKGDNEGIERKVVAEIRRCGAERRVAIQSFDDSVLEELHRLAPDIRLEKLFICKLWGLPILFDGGFSRFDFEKYAYVRSFNIYHRSLTPRLAERIRRHGKQVKVWTADDPELAPLPSVDGIITNRPDLWIGRKTALETLP